jgi:hypothetical protein
LWFFGQVQLELTLCSNLRFQPLGLSLGLISWAYLRALLTTDWDGTRFSTFGVHCIRRKLPFLGVLDPQLSQSRMAKIGKK